VLSTTVPVMSTVRASSRRWCSQREPGFQSDTLTRTVSDLGPTQYWAIRSVSTRACHTFGGVVAM
jgi:hypothetical protein